MEREREGRQDIIKPRSNRERREVEKPRDVEFV